MNRKINIIIIGMQIEGKGIQVDVNEPTLENH